MGRESAGRVRRRVRCQNGAYAGARSTLVRRRLSRANSWRVAGTIHEPSSERSRPNIESKWMRSSSSSSIAVSSTGDRRPPVSPPRRAPAAGSWIQSETNPNSRASKPVNCAATGAAPSMAPSAAACRIARATTSCQVPDAARGQSQACCAVVESSVFPAPHAVWASAPEERHSLGRSAYA